jgi:hypothetical protein
LDSGLNSGFGCPNDSQSLMPWRFRTCENCLKPRQKSLFLASFSGKVADWRHNWSKPYTGGWFFLLAAAEFCFLFSTWRDSSG